MTVVSKYLLDCIPYDKSYTIFEHQQISHFSVREAIKTNPDRNKPESDYIEIMSVDLDHGAGVPVGTPAETRLCIDSLGILTVEARDPAKPDKPPITNHVELKNLS